MTIGIAIVIAMVLYLIDRNKVWRQTAKIAAALILLAVLGVAGIFGWQKFSDWRMARKEAANQREAAAWNSWLDNLPACKAVLFAPAASQIGRTYVVGEKRTYLSDGIDLSAGLVDFVTPDSYDKLAAEAAHDTLPCKAQWIDPQWKVVSETAVSKDSQKPWLKYAAQAEAEEQAKYCAVLKNYVSVTGGGQPDTLPADFFAKKDYFEQNCKRRPELPTCADYEKQQKIPPPPSGYKITDAKGNPICR
jgi:hypothetical protein